jgi:hypothetical protein
MSVLFSGDFTIDAIPPRIAQRVVVRSHYLHRPAPCSHAWGLYLKGELIGCIMYGTPASSSLRAGICGPEHVKDVIELTRLWIDDRGPRNAESFLIGHTLRKVPKEIIVSFADASFGHRGVVYQATNWIYTGLSAKRTDWTIEGSDLHSHTLADAFTSSEIRERFGDDFKLKDRPRKHRYIFFNCSRSRRKVLLAKLRYPVVSYPKGAAVPRLNVEATEHSGMAELLGQSQFGWTK